MTRISFEYSAGLRPGMACGRRRAVLRRSRRDGKQGRGPRVPLLPMLALMLFRGRQHARRAAGAVWRHPGTTVIGTATTLVAVGLAVLYVALHVEVDTVHITTAAGPPAAVIPAPPPPEPTGAQPGDRAWPALAAPVASKHAPQRIGATPAPAVAATRQPAPHPPSATTAPVPGGRPSAATPAPAPSSPPAAVPVSPPMPSASSPAPTTATVTTVCVNLPLIGGCVTL